MGDYYPRWEFEVIVGSGTQDVQEKVNAFFSEKGLNASAHPPVVTLVFKEKMTIATVVYLEN